MNFVLAPLEIMLIPFFYKVGTWVLRGDPLPFSASELLDHLREVLDRIPIGSRIFDIPLIVFVRFFLLKSRRLRGHFPVRQQIAGY